MLPTKDTQHVAESLALLIDQFKNKTVIKGYLSTLARRVQDVENVLWDIIELRRLDVATGIQLDKLGLLVGEKRIGRSDTDYRNGIRLRIRVNRSKGRIVDIIDVASLAGQGTNIPKIIEYAFLGFEVDLFGQTGERYIADLLSHTRAATSYGILVASDLAASSLLIWDDAVSPGGVVTFSDAISGGLVCASAYGLPSDFTGIVLASAVSLTSLAPTSGSTGGATSVTLTGVNLTGTTGVTFDGVPATSVVVGSSTTVTCVTPAHAGAGAVNVTITTPSGSSTLVGGFTYSAAGAAPGIPTVATSGGAVGDIDGIYSATLTLTNATGATGVTFGGTAATAVVVVNSTTITCTVPAHATGSVSVVVTGPGGSSPANTAFRFFSPAELSPTGWWRGDFAASALPAVASGGSSGTAGNLAAGGGATAGTALNAHVPATTNGTSQYLLNASLLSSLFTTTAGEICALTKPASAKAAQAAGSEYLDPYVFGDHDNGGLGLSYSSAGFKMFFYDGAYKVAVKTSSTATWAGVFGRWDSANVTISVNGTAGTSAATGAFAAGTANSVGMGASYSNTGFLAADTEEILTFAAKLTAQNELDVRSYWNTRYFPAGAQV